ncbi:MAG: hypothetical protein O9303_13270 [Silanimonas sp.]|nr:hypothetical protein [Silanimonas sp.]
MKKTCEKSFDLKTSNLIGGRSNQETFRYCKTATQTSGCTDMNEITYDDNGKIIDTCTDFDCP